MKKKKLTLIRTLLPIVKNINARTLAQDIKGFDPNNPKDVEEWDKIMKDMIDPIKQMYKDASIPWPEIVIDHTKGPITYAIKTVDASGNVLHSQP
jgi:hypothetical protein